jgi:hypothetical protein
MYRDYDNSDPDALNAFVSDLAGRRVPMDTVKRSNDESQSGLCAVSDTTTSTGSITGLDSTRSGSTGASQGSSISTTPRTPAGASAGRISQVALTHNQSISQGYSQPEQRKKKFLELCVNTGQHSIYLGEIEVSDAKSDGELFSRINQRYRELRGFRFQRIFLKPADVHFVHVSSGSHRNSHS